MPGVVLTWKGMTMTEKMKEFVHGASILKCRALLFAAQLAFVQVMGNHAGAFAAADCRVEHVGDLLNLSNQYFRWTVDISAGPRAVQCENLLTGSKVDLHRGEEASLRFSGAHFGSISRKGFDTSGQQRFELVDWTQATGGAADEHPDEEKGFAAEYYRPDFNDLNWTLTASPWELNNGAAGSTVNIPNPSGYNWFRHRLILPGDARGRTISIVLGGCGLYDFGNQRIFLNGKLIGEREIEQQWEEPGLYRLTPDQEAYEHLRFGNGNWNVIAVQAWNCFDNRPRHLRKMDSRKWFRPSRELRLMEHAVTVGEAFVDVPLLKVTGIDVQSEGTEGRLRLAVETSLPSLAASLWYEWSADEPALRKWLELENTTRPGLLLEVNLGSYPVDLPATEGFRGFPVYLNDEMFFSVAHPAGVAQGGYGSVRMCHFPGRQLWPGENFTSKQAVIGFAETGGALQSFHDYIIRRSPRKQESLVKWNGFGAAWARKAWISPLEENWQTVDTPSEETMMLQLDKMEELQESLGLSFDYFWIDHGWRCPEVMPWLNGQEYNGQLRSSMLVLSPTGWPNGPGRMVQRIEGLGMRLGLWLAAGHAECCSLADTQQLWRNAMKRHIQENNVAGFKFDGMVNRCWSTDHNHLPGKYSIEMGADGKINFYNYARQLKPDIFLMFYYGHDSPWWLLWGDTLYDSGVAMEAASPSSVPTLMSIRESVAIGLDQCLRFDADVPPQGKDSLGTWLSKSLWNNSIGPEHWLPALVLDISRGSAIANPWADLNVDIRPDEYPVLAHLTRLLKSSPDCFLNTKPVLGSPWREEPYGYLGSNGRRAFLTVNNPTWRDQKISIEIGSELGLPSVGEWEIYLHFPVTGRAFASQDRILQSYSQDSEPVVSNVMTGKQRIWNSREQLSWYQGPFEVVLLEIAPKGEGSVTEEVGEEVQLPTFPSGARELTILSEPSRPVQGTPTKERSIKVEIPPCPSPAIFALVLRMTSGDLYWRSNMSNVFQLSGTISGETVGPDGEEGDFPLQYTTIPDKQHSCWLVFKIQLDSSKESRSAELTLADSLPADVSVEMSAQVVPELTRMGGRFF
jgi:hypothetical protein